MDGIPLLTQKTGVGRYTFELASALEGLSEAPEIVFYYRTHWSKRLKTSAFPSNDIRHRLLKNAMLRFIPKSLKEWIGSQVLKIGDIRYQPDLFHATNYVAGPFSGPIVVTVHDLSHVRYPETHPVERLEWLSEGLQQTLHQARHIIVDSQFTRDELISLFCIPEKMITVVHLGIRQEFKPWDDQILTQELKEFDLEPKCYILSVGTLEPRKNLLTLLQAYELLPDSLKTRFPLVVVGMSGWKERAISMRLEALIRSGKIRVLGYISDDKLPFIYAGAWLFVYPSLYEGFGLPVLEAMASGVPVVISNRTSLPEVVGNAGTFIDPEDIELLAQTLESLLDDQERHQQMNRMGLQRAAQFTWKACAEKTFKVYQNVLA